MAAVEDSMLIETAFVVNEDKLDFDSNGAVVLGEFCATGDSVYKIRA